MDICILIKGVCVGDESGKPNMSDTATHRISQKCGRVVLIIMKDNRRLFAAIYSHVRYSYNKLQCID